jgi:hypothetical protein
VSVYPAAGGPHLIVQRSLKWPAGATRHEGRFALSSGVLIHGRVVETPSGAPVLNATIAYEPRTQDNPHARRDTRDAISAWWLQDTRSGPDGTFELAVLPGPGWLLVKGPSADYIHVAVSARQLECGKAGGMPYFPDALVPLDLDLKPGGAAREVVVPLRRGVTVSGRVLAHDNSPTTSTFLLAPSYLAPKSSPRGTATQMRLPTRDGHFELPGCDPERSVPVLFFDTSRQQGAVVELSGKQTGQALVNLAPCGSATARFVDARGRPIPRPKVWLDVLLRPGADLQDSIAKDVDACVTVSVQRLWGTSCINADARSGVLTFTHLIPGATYLVQTDEGNGIVRKAVIMVQPGERVELPDIVLRSQDAGKS